MLFFELTPGPSLSREGRKAPLLLKEKGRGDELNGYAIIQIALLF